MLSQLKNLFAVPEQKASRTAQLIAFESSRRARWTPRDYAALAREGYAKNAIVYRAVRLPSRSARSRSCSTRARSSTTRIRCSTCWQRQIRARTAPRSRKALPPIYCLPAMPMSRPRELYALRPDRMKVVAGPDGWPQAFE
jgi:phage portal protein BeeE